MGWLMDVGNIAVGAIDRDRQITKEDLAIRAENLQANRKILVDQKKKKYDRELDNYYAEKKIFDQVEKNNELKASDGISDRNYAIFALKHSNPDFKDLGETEQTLQINNYLKDGNKTINYKLTGTPEEINKDAARIQTMINDETSKAIKDAKGNSFLINTILGDKKKAEQSLLEQMESKINATDAVNRTEQEVNQANVGLEVKGDGSLSKTINDKTFEAAWIANYGKINFDLDSKNNKSFKYLNKFASIGGAGELTLKFDKTDSKIVGHNGNSVTNLLAMEKMYTDIRDSKDAATHYHTISKNSTSIGKNFNNDTVFKELSNIITRDGRVTNIDGRISSDGKNYYNLTTIVPLSIVGTNDKLALGNAGNFDIKDKAAMKKVSKLMADFIVAKADKIDDKTVDSQAKVAAIYSELFMGETDIVNQFKNYLVNNDAEIKTFYETNKDKKVESTDGATKTTDDTTEKLGFKIVSDKDNINSIEVPSDNAIFGKKKGTVIPLTKDNIVKLKALNNPEIDSLISEGVKFGIDLDKMAPNLDNIPEFINITNKRGGTRRVPNPDHPKNKIKIPVGIPQINKTKVR